MDISFTEVMPLGEDAAGNIDHFFPLDRVVEALAKKYTLTPSAFASGVQRVLANSPEPAGASA